jgi:hypothetical protein
MEKAWAKVVGKVIKAPTQPHPQGVGDGFAGGVVKSAVSPSGDTAAKSGDTTGNMEDTAGKEVAPW